MTTLNAMTEASGNTKTLADLEAGVWDFSGGEQPTEPGAFLAKDLMLGNGQTYHVILRVENGMDEDDPYCEIESVWKRAGEHGGAEQFVDVRADLLGAGMALDQEADKVWEAVFGPIELPSFPRL